MTHIGKNISTKDEQFFFVHEETGAKKEMSFDEVQSLIEETLKDLDEQPDQAEHNQQVICVTLFIIT